MKTKQIGLKLEESDAQRLKQAEELTGKHAVDIIRHLVFDHLDEYVRDVAEERQRKIDEFLKSRR